MENSYLLSLNIIILITIICSARKPTDSDHIRPSVRVSSGDTQNKFWSDRSAFFLNRAYSKIKNK